jgi:hypothetical protein
MWWQWGKEKYRVMTDGNDPTRSVYQFLGAFVKKNAKSGY